MPAQESDLPPVPDDPVDGPGAASMISTAQLPWTAIPKFVPGTTNVQDYVKKLEFLAAMWPTEHLDLLAPRAALLVEGSAFATIAKLDASKLKVKSLDGVKALVKAIGGSWGATDFEERFEFFEKALYGTLQKSDESNDSFISRMEAVFSELLSRGTTLEEVQACPAETIHAGSRGQEESVARAQGAQVPACDEGRSPFGQPLFP